MQVKKYTYLKFLIYLKILGYFKYCKKTRIIISFFKQLSLINAITTKTSIIHLSLSFTHLLSLEITVFINLGLGMVIILGIVSKHIYQILLL